MATLQGAIDELIAVVRGVSGIKAAPDDPVESIATGPMAVVYASTGRSRNEPNTTIKYLHNPVIAVVMPLRDIAAATQVMMPFIESVPAALVTHRNGRTSNHYQTFGDIGYSMGPIDWGATTMYGLLFTIESLKITNSV